MNYFDSNFLKFIEYFKSHKEITNISRTSTILKISRRMIYYYIEKVNDILLAHDLEKVIKMNSGTYTLTSKQIECIDLKLASEKPSQYIFSKKERIELIILSILLGGRPIYLKDCSNWFSVSKNTIINDFKIVKNTFKVYDIQLVSKKNKGYYCEINEMLRRNLILKYLNEIDTESDKQLTLELLNFNTSDSTIKNYSVVYDRCIKSLKKAEIILSKEISYSNRVLLAKAIAIIGIYRQEHGGIVTKTQLNLLKQRIEYKASQFIINDLNTLISFGEQEILYLTVLLLCIDKDSDFHFNSVTFKDILNISNSFVDNFERVSDIYFSDKNEVIKQIQTQMKVIYYRQLFKQVSLSDNLKLDDRHLLTIFRLVKNIFENMWLDGNLTGIYKNKISEFDCYELSLKIQSLILEEQIKEKEMKVLLVTDDSYTNNNILKAKIMRAVSTLKIKNIVTVDECIDDKQKYDFCLTTIESFRHPILKTIFVHKYLDSSDYIELLKINELKTQNRIKSEVAKIINSANLEIEEKVRKIDEIYRLKSIELNYFKESNLNISCPPQCRYYFENRVDVSESLNIIIKGIRNLNVLGEDELKNISLSSENKNKYAFIFPDVLLIHANNNINELESRVILCGYEYPVNMDFNGKNREVKYVVIMISDIYMSHLNILLEIEELVNKKQLMKFIQKQ